jgi:hypothetical protein
MNLMETLKASVALEDSKLGKNMKDMNQASSIHDAKPAAGNLAAALAAAQSTMKAAPFDRTNPHFKSKYASLASVVDTIRKPLADNGLSYTQTTEIREGALILITTLRHRSGEIVTSEYPLPGMSKPQELGSALTYARRYSLSALVCIAADDDDDAEGVRKSEQMTTLPKKDSGAIYKKLQAELDATKSPADLEKWATANKARIAILPRNWCDILRLRYAEHAAAISGKKEDEIPSVTDSAFLDWIDYSLGAMVTQRALNTFWNTVIEPRIPDDAEHMEVRGDALAVFSRHEERIKAAEQ